LDQGFLVEEVVNADEKVVEATLSDALLLNQLFHGLQG
jgi:hypothetical protein